MLGVKLNFFASMVTVLLSFRSKEYATVTAQNQLFPLPDMGTRLKFHDLITPSNLTVCMSSTAR